MKLSVQNLHCAVNKEQATQTVITYEEEFAKAIKESIKSVTKWTVHCGCYPLPESAVSLNALKFPKRM